MPSHPAFRAGLCLAALAAAPLHAEEPANWLVRVSDATHTATYQGVLIYRGSDSLESLKIWHRSRGGDERERLVSMSGEAREVLRRGDEVTNIVPPERKITVERQAGKGLFPAMSKETAQGLASYYDVQEVGAGRVAGRSCKALRILPRDSYRYGYDLCIDDAHGVPLKIGLMDPAGRLLEQMMFTEVSFPPTIPDRAFEAQTDTRGYQRVVRSVTADRASAQAANWQARRLPPGFSVRARDLRVLADGRSVEHLLISDGLSAVSVFSAQRPDEVFQGVSQMGAVHAYGRRVGTIHFTVVGEVPRETVRMIGDGLLAPGDARAPEAVPADDAAGDSPN